jgi:DNA-binding XRE family transcriptional regulator
LYNQKQLTGFLDNVGKHKVKIRNVRKLKAFGANLKKLRAEANMTQEQLADRAGVSENTIVTIESGKLNTTIATCFDLAKGLGVSVSELFQF